MKLKAFAFFILCFLSGFVYAQNFQDKYHIKAIRAKISPKIDGIINDEIWNNAPVIGDFWQKFPTSDVKAQLPTFVQASFDDKYIYFAVKCMDSTNQYVAPTLKRDNTIRESDGVALILDPLNRKTNGFSFSSTPYNVQTEYLIGGSADGQSVNTAWDNKWFSEVKRYDTYYTVEFAIPFKTLRYETKNKVWGFNIIRSDIKNFKFYTWTNVPVQFPGFDLGYVGTLTFEEELPSAKKNYALIPFITGGLSKSQGEKANASFGAGFDAKLALTPSINMDFTLLPDFSQVDVDQQVTNLTRFSIFFPERRTFFLENDDVFSDYGNPPIRPFFSRRIGLDQNNNPIPIVFGAKLSGNLSESLRIGAFNMQTANKDDYNAQNFTAISAVQRIGKRSSVKGYVHNVSTDLDSKQENLRPFDKYGRNAGGEIALSDAGGKYQAWAGFHASAKPGQIEKNTFGQLGVGYYGKNFSFFTDYASVEDHYYTDMGFVNRIETFSKVEASYDSRDTTYRNGFKQSFTNLEYTIRPKGKKLASINFSLNNYLNFFQNNTFTEHSNEFETRSSFKNSSSIIGTVSYSNENLIYYFPLPSKKPLNPGYYRYANAALEYRSDTRKNFLWQLKYNGGGFYNGTINQYTAQTSVRNQPWWTISLLAQYNILKFPEEYGTTKLLLISPKTEVNFSNKMFWTTFYQFNTQANNFNINSRLQYRYSPMSDLFIVYTDNYFTDPLFKNKNRGIIFKLNYWLS
jgi:hypothetical protein